jgi:hypothetical protein
MAGGVIYSRQPNERRENIRAAAAQLGKFVLDQIMEATTEVEVVGNRNTHYAGVRVVCGDRLMADH